MELGKFLKTVGGDRPIASITKNEGRTYKEHLIQDRGVSLATVANHLHTLSGLFTWAEKQGFMHEGAPNPVKGLAPTKTESEKTATGIRPFTTRSWCVCSLRQTFSNKRRHVQIGIGFLYCAYSNSVAGKKPPSLRSRTLERKNEFRISPSPI